MKLYSKEIVSVTLSVTNNKRTRLLNKNDNPLQYFLKFLDFAYFFHYIPFRLVYLKTGGFYLVKSPTSHKVLCGIVHLLSAYRFAFSIFEVTSSYKSGTEGHNPVLYFELGRTIMTIVYMFVFKWAFWTRAKLFGSIVNELLAIKPYSLLDTKQKSALSIKRIATVICFMYSIPPIISVVVGSMVIKVTSWEPIRLLEAYAGATRKAFLLQSSSTPYPIGSFSVGTCILMSLYVIMNFYNFLGGHYFDLSILMGALTLRHLSKEFASNVKNVGDPYFINKLLDEYKFLKQMSIKVNRAIGCVTFCFVIEAFPYYATHLDDILTLDDLYSRFRYMFYIFNFFSILIIASDIPLKVDTFRVWLTTDDNCLALPSSKVTALLNDLMTYPVGIKAGGVLPITYGFIGTMVSVVITYAVIIIQFNYTSSHSCPNEL